MFDSLKSWMTCDIEILPFQGLSGSADKIYAEPVTIKGYWAGETAILNDAIGTEIISGTQFYFDSTKYDVDPRSRVIVDGQEKDIIRISNYMDGNTGTSSIKVGYL